MSLFVIPERLASIRAVVLAFTANKQTNKRTNEHSQLYRYVDVYNDQLYNVFSHLYDHACIALDIRA